MKKRAKFNLSNFHNCTFKMGQLYPVHLQEVLPGDSIQQSTSVFLRFAPLVAPVMHPTYMFAHTFYCPTRVLGNLVDWDFESFITGGDDGLDAQTVPRAALTETNAPVGSLPEAFGLPMQSLASGNAFFVNMLPFLMYYLIWNEYYRDQDLQEPVDFSYWSDRFINPSPFSLLSPCWSKDYFTTARPWPQKGPEVTIPVNAAGSGISGTVQTTISSDGSMLFKSADDSDSRPLIASNSGSNEEYTSPVYYGSSGSHPSYGAGALSYMGGLSASSTFSSTTPVGIGSINVTDLREAMSLQRFEEHRALWGSRYEDLLRYLGVRPQDARLQLPEYLGGFSAPVQFSEVLQTSAGETGGVGDLYGHGISAARGSRIRRFIPEHGYIMTLLCVRPIPVYSQGIERLWSKRTKYDFWTKELEHIGQQEVLNSEVYADGSSQDGNTFGYQNRYDEYRRGVSVVTGEFRTNQDFWTLARIFANRPALNSDFVECNPSDRIFQVGEQNSDQLYVMVKNNVIAKRLVSKNGNPI